MTARRTSALVPYTKLKRNGAHLMYGVREKTAWFMNNIAKTHPKPSVYLRPRRGRNLARTSDAAQEIYDEASSTRSRTCSHEALPPRALRSSKKVKSLQEDSDLDSDIEDFGQLCSVPYEDSTRSGLTQYYSAVSHVSGLHNMAAVAELSMIDEDSGVAFTSPPRCGKERSSNDPGLFQISCSRSLEDSASRFTIQPPRTPCLLEAPTPSIVLTMPTPQISQSPVFQPRSPITLAKYVQATSFQSPCLPPSASTVSLSPVPSIPSCNRCCLAQLEDGIICRACERQWLACKVWYQAHDGGRRQQLTEPFIRPGESNASTRAVMGVLGVPGSTSAAVGLGFDPSVTLRKKLPFKVVEPAIQPPCSRCNYESCTRPGNCRSRATPWRYFRRHSLDAVRKARDTIRALLSVSFKSVPVVPPPRSWSWLPRGRLAFAALATPDAYDTPTTS
ncbi:hypothetical protein OH76DRAFT_1442777 [Lentinus brumalis]|uniref:Uncharacterized protein n=1 Tax=Lentinus brumalis TaxID=2498619 RepID=A0A371D2P0_9APHY|nr:hypothetical protein OH76DRAFT_1442777 [Polyporus brumalis]